MSSTGTIERFRGDHYFLSNMYELSTWLETPEGIAVPTSEHAYQSARFADDFARRAVARARDGKEAKSFAHELIEQGMPQLENWETVKVDIMESIVREKFRCNLILAEELAATGQLGLFEGNTWGDNFWGVSPVGSRNGYNHLGRILMTIRDEV